MLRTDEFDFPLPEELIAAHPTERRDGARMIVVHRQSGEIEHRRFTDFPGYVGDHLLVLNDVRVARARFLSPDGRVEILRLGRTGPLAWRCMVRPGKKFRLHAAVEMAGARGRVTQVEEDGTRHILWATEPDEETHGHLALPPYMRRPDGPEDLERYQTVFAKEGQGTAVAAPTAGLHFTPELLGRLPHVCLTLHVGAGTFLPVKAERLDAHIMHRESYEITPEAAARISAAPRRLAVGTTVARVLEHVARTQGRVSAHHGETAIFLHPPCDFQLTDALLTNFHLPRSTLFMLVCALGGMELMRRAYAEAVAQRYRFFSYGDCMLIL